MRCRLVWAAVRSMAPINTGRPVDQAAHRINHGLQDVIMMGTRPVAAAVRPGLQRRCRAQAKTRIDEAADLPRFEYRVGGKLEDVVRQGERFEPLAAQVRRDLEQLLAAYEIAVKSTQRDLLTNLALLDFLDGRYDSALARAEPVKKL
jgi:hypothetical protein